MDQQTKLIKYIQSGVEVINLDIRDLPKAEDIKNKKFFIYIPNKIVFNGIYDMLVRLGWKFPYIEKKYEPYIGWLILNSAGLVGWYDKDPHFDLLEFNRDVWSFLIVLTESSDYNSVKPHIEKQKVKQSIFKTSEEGKTHLRKIIKQMRKEGIDYYFTKLTLKLGEVYEGIYDLAVLWKEEEDPKEKEECLKDIQKLINETVIKNPEFFCK